MKKHILRIFALTLALLLTLLCAVSCGGKGKTLMTLKKDGVTVTLSVNLYELMLSRMKGNLCYYGYTANGVKASESAFWSFQDKFDGETFETIDDYYCGVILENCQTYLAALYLFEKAGLTLSAKAEKEIEDRLSEILRTDGEGSKTKLNAVLAAYGVNYDLLKEAYTLQAKVDAVQEHLYGKDAAGVGPTVKDEFMRENYLHFRQIFLPAYNYVYETDENKDVIYYYTEGEKKDRVYYDVHNGVVGYNEDGSKITDENGDVVYFAKDSDYKKIAYDSINGKPAYVMNEEGSEYKTEKMTEDELKALSNRAEGLFETLKDSTDAEFEAAISKEDTNAALGTDYDDGYYLQKNLDYLASGEGNKYLSDIIEALDGLEDGGVAIVESIYGYHIVKKYPHTEKAYEKEENATWFENFATDLVEKLFLEECEKLFADIKINEDILAQAPKMKEVGINYYY